MPRTPRPRHAGIHGDGDLQLERLDVERPVHSVGRRQSIAKRWDPQASDAVLLVILEDLFDFREPIERIDDHRRQDLLRVAHMRLTDPLGVVGLHDRDHARTDAGSVQSLEQCFRGVELRSVADVLEQVPEPSLPRIPRIEEARVDQRIHGSVRHGQPSNCARRWVAKYRASSPAP